MTSRFRHLETTYWRSKCPRRTPPMKMRPLQCLSMSEIRSEANLISQKNWIFWITNGGHYLISWGTTVSSNEGLCSMELFCLFVCPFVRLIPHSYMALNSSYNWSTVHFANKQSTLKPYFWSHNIFKCYILPTTGTGGGHWWMR